MFCHYSAQKATFLLHNDLGSAYQNLQEPVWKYLHTFFSIFSLCFLLFKYEVSFSFFPEYVTHKAYTKLS